MTDWRPSTNFSEAEAACKDGTLVPTDLRPNVALLCKQLEVIRAEVGSPIHVDDMYRTPEHNATLPGAALHSQHLVGKAADIWVAGISAGSLYGVVERLIDTGRIMQGGLGLYSTFVHYDIRGKYARWHT